MAKTWSIKVNDVSQNYKTIKFERALNTNSPTTFEATIAYNAAINFFDVVKIMRDNTLEWKGFVESIETNWDDQGRYMTISGRDTSVILWKKYCEGFTEMDESLGGFFGQVSAVELIKFLLRCPSSDAVVSYPNNKQGWGLDISKFVGFKAYRSSSGQPDWTKLRKRGYGWKNSGTDFNTALLDCDSAVLDEWAHFGTPPYLTVKDDNYIYSATVNQISEWNCENLPTNATNINAAKLKMYWKPAITWNPWVVSECEVWLWVASRSMWVWLFTLTGRDFGWDHGWRYEEFDIKNYLDNVADVNAAKIKFINKSSSLATKITYCSLGITYSTSGTQHVTDYFDINFKETENVCGIYIECRQYEDAYARNYKIVSLLDTLENWSTYSEVDPNNHITLEDSNLTIHHDNYQNETAYLYKDYGANGLENFDHKFSFKITSTEVHPYAYCPWMVSNNLEDLKTAIDTAGHYFAAFIVNSDLNSLTLLAKVKDSGGIGTSSSSVTLSLNTTYYCRVMKDQGTDTIEFFVYDSEDMEEQNLLMYESFTIDDGLNFRYRFQGITYNGLEWGQRFSDSFENTLTNWTRNGGDAATSFGTAAPAPAHGTYDWQITCDADEGAYVEKETTEAEEFYVQWYNYFNSGPNSETLNVDLAVDVDGWTFETNEWTHINTEPWLHNDDENDRISSNAVSFPTDSYWEFEHLNSKYGAVSLTNLYVKLKGRLYDGTGGHADYIRVKAYLWDGSFWQMAGNFDFNSTSWQEPNGGVSLHTTINTIAKINSMRLKLVVDSIQNGGADKGGIYITYAYVHIEGTGYWGRVTLAKIFDKDVAGINNPNVNIIAAAEARVMDVTSNQDKYYFAMWGHDNSGYWEETQTTYYFPVGSWIRLRLAAKTGSGDGYAIFYEVQGAVAYTRVSKTSITNYTMGKPDCCDVEIDCFNLASGIFYIDYAQIYTKQQTHTNGYIYSITHQELELVPTVSNNVFRDIIHSWQPQTLDNIRIYITNNDENFAWAISQVYVYFAPELKYRVYLDNLTEPSPPPPYAGGPYIKELTFDSSYVTPIGPLNIGMSRLIDAVNAVVEKCHSSYVPFRWWVEYNDNNTFHFKQRRGSDKSASITFEGGVNLEGVNRSRTVDDTVQRLKIIGRGEGKRQEEVSSDWQENTSEMDNVRTFFEDVITEKVYANKDIADLIAQIKLSEIAAIQDQATVMVSKDDNLSMAYDCGDDVTITDSLTNMSGAKRIWNINKLIDNNGEHITLSVGRPWKDQEDEWADIYRRLKELGIVGTVGDDLSGEGGDKNKIDAEKVTDFWEQQAKHDDVTLGNDRTDPIWWKNPNPDGESPPTDGRNIEIDSENLGMYGPSSGSGTQTIEIEMRYMTTTNGPLDTFDINLQREPKLICEAKTYEITSGSTKYWKTGDFCEFGLYDISTTKGFMFRVKKETDGSFKVYAVFNLTGSNEEEYPIRTIDTNTKYRYEMYYEKNRGIFYFNVYDVENEEEIPPSYVITESNFDFTVKPLYCKISGDSDGGTFWARFYIYHLRSEWTRIG